MPSVRCALIGCKLTDLIRKIIVLVNMCSSVVLQSMLDWGGLKLFQCSIQTIAGRRRTLLLA